MPRVLITSCRDAVGPVALLAYLEVFVDFNTARFVCPVTYNNKYEVNGVID